jgi:hypothetical protein
MITLKRTHNLMVVLLCTLFTSAIVNANEVASEGYADDWKSPEAITDAMYNIISAGPNQKRNWDRFRDLFFDNAEMLIAMQSSQFSGIIAADIEAIIAQTDSAYGKTGFHELEITKEVVRYGNMANVYSSFEVKLKTTDETPLMKGLNHFQLLFDGDRWWIISNTGIIDNKTFKGSQVL